MAHNSSESTLKLMHQPAQIAWMSSSSSLYWTLGRFDITLKDDIATVLAPKIAAALETQGMSVISKPDATAKKLTISVDRLSLDSLKSDGFGYLTLVNAEVVASIDTTTTRFSKRYTVSTEKEMSSASSTQTTQEMLNAALSKALSDVLADDTLIGVLTQ